MPTYDYECPKCGHKFEYFQSMRDEPLKKCPKCSSSVKRLIGSGAGIIFKGSGFYATDYKAKSQKGSADRARNARGSAESQQDSAGTCPKKDEQDPNCKSCNAEKPK